MQQLFKCTMIDRHCHVRVFYDAAMTGKMFTYRLHASAVHSMHECIGKCRHGRCLAMKCPITDNAAQTVRQV